ncbi:MAG TPA: DUF3658 domain-containing protein, partial [Ktedonobacterales bacterium]|nr:DUF3658 domain-containing protein [Ktedonobacterales bacterium]
MTGSSDDLDATILSVCSPIFQEVAEVIVRSLEQSGVPIHDQQEKDANRVALRIETLIQGGRLECAGNVRPWRSSEVRLPQQPTWVYADHHDDCTILSFCSVDGINRLAIESIAEFGRTLEALRHDPKPLVITGN